jgi:hypothetical protein
LTTIELRRVEGKGNRTNELMSKRDNISMGKLYGKIRIEYNIKRRTRWQKLRREANDGIHDANIEGP